jgi:hypothetical protein
MANLGGNAARRPLAESSYGCGEECTASKKGYLHVYSPFKVRLFPYKQAPENAAWFD